jgi:hypothetical protein
MLYAYCDETAHDQSDQYMFIAGMLGTESQWQTFDKQWRAAGGAGFKATNASRVNRPKRAEKLRALAAIPYECGLHPMLSGLRVSDYWDLVQGSDEEKRARGWYCALRFLLFELLLFIPDTERVIVMLDRQVEYSECVKDLFDSVVDYPDGRFRTRDGFAKLANWGFETERDSLRTRPGEYLAYAAMQRMRDPGSERALLTKPILDPMYDMEKVGVVMSREEIRDLMGVLYSPGAILNRKASRT